MSKAKAKKQTQIPVEVEKFFSSEIATKAASGLSPRAVVKIHLGEQIFFFQKVAGKNQLHVEMGEKADVIFWIQENAMRKILSSAKSKGAGIGKLGILIFELIFSRDESSRIYFRVDAGFLALWSKGYFSVLKLGGPEVATYIANKGFGSLGKIKEALKAMRG